MLSRKQRLAREIYERQMHNELDGVQIADCGPKKSAKDTTARLLGKFPHIDNFPTSHENFFEEGED